MAGLGWVRGSGVGGVLLIGALKRLTSGVVLHWTLLRVVVRVAGHLVLAALHIPLGIGILSARAVVVVSIVVRHWMQV